MSVEYYYEIIAIPFAAELVDINFISSIYSDVLLKKITGTRIFLRNDEFLSKKSEKKISAPTILVTL